MYQNAAYAYRDANVLTANPLKLVLMCYDGAITSLKLAKEAYIRKDYESKAKALRKALDIIHELDASLDMNRGGEISRNLRGLYLFMTQSLIEADMKGDLRMMERIIGLLQELESAWLTISLNGESLNGEARPGENQDDVKARPAGIPLSVLKPAPAARSWSA